MISMTRSRMKGGRSTVKCNCHLGKVCLQCPEGLFDKVDFREDHVFHGFMRLLLFVSDRLHWVL